MINVRWMIRRDMRQVLDIEDSSFESPWQEEDFIMCLRQRNCIGMVAEMWDEPSRDYVVVGYMIYHLMKDRITVLNFAVHPDHRRRGVAKTMTDKLRNKLNMFRRRKVEMHVLDTNLPMQLFLRTQGYRAHLPIAKEFFENKQDAYYFTLEPFGAAQDEPSLQPMRESA